MAMTTTHFIFFGITNLVSETEGASTSSKTISLSFSFSFSRGACKLT